MDVSSTRAACSAPNIGVQQSGLILGGDELEAAHGKSPQARVVDLES